MAETSKCQTVLPEKLWGGNVRHGTPSSHEESTGDSQSVQDHTTRFGIPIRSSHAYLSLAHIPEEKSNTEYHKYYNIDQAGPGVIALKDVEEFPLCLIKVRRIPKLWRFQAASHKNLISFLDSYQSIYSAHKSTSIYYSVWNMILKKAGGQSAQFEFRSRHKTTYLTEFPVPKGV